VAGRTPQEAVSNFLEPLGAVISCLTNSVLSVRGGYSPAAEPHAMVLGEGGAIRLSGADLSLRIIQHYRIVEAAEQRGPWKISTAAYMYSLESPLGTELLAFHWHPAGRSTVTTPHLHLGAAANVGHPALANAHLPTGRIAIEDFVRLTIVAFRVRPLRDDWEEVLLRAQTAFDQWRTW